MKILVEAYIDKILVEETVVRAESWVGVGVAAREIYSDEYELKFSLIF